MSELILRKRGRRGSPESWSVDAHVGQRVRMRRTLLGMSQERLGEAIGLTFQQVQKYERGSNRISAGTLFRLSQVLDVPVSFFFDAYEDPQGNGGGSGSEAVVATGDGGVISRREARLLRLWRAAPAGISDEVLALLSSLSPHLRDPLEEADTAEAPRQQAATSKPPSQSRKPTKPESSQTDVGTAEKSRRPRRRHGAVWDPTDIYRSAKN